MNQSEWADVYIMLCRVQIVTGEAHSLCLLSINAVEKKTPCVSTGAWQQWGDHGPPLPAEDFEMIVLVIIHRSSQPFFGVVSVGQCYLLIGTFL